MDDRTRDDGGQAHGDLVAEAEAQVLRLGRKLGEIIARLETDDLAAAGEVPVAMAALDKALGAVFSERAKRERNGGNAANGGQLDLGAAAVEVRHRLARLRAVGGAGGAAGGAE